MNSQRRIVKYHGELCDSLSNECGLGEWFYFLYNITLFIIPSYVSNAIKVANRMTDNDWNVKKLLQSLILVILLIRILRLGQARQVNRM